MSSIPTTIEVNSFEALRMVFLTANIAWIKDSPSGEGCIIGTAEGQVKIRDDYEDVLKKLSGE